jgi:hypothetical protein
VAERAENCLSLAELYILNIIFEYNGSDFTIFNFKNKVSIENFLLKRGAIMNKNTVIQCSGHSFFQRQLFKLKINQGIKECSTIIESLKRHGKLGREDIKINILIPCIDNNDIHEKYLVHKGYNSDGSMKPMIKYRIYNGRVTEETVSISKNVVILDLYERSIYLYEYKVDEQYATGYVLRDEKGHKGATNLIFTRERVKVLLKNVNTYKEYESVDSFICEFLM